MPNRHIFSLRSSLNHHRYLDCFVAAIDCIFDIFYTDFTLPPCKYQPLSKRNQFHAFSDLRFETSLQFLSCPDSFKSI